VPGSTRAPVNWFVVGAAGGVALTALVGLALFCVAPRRAARPIEVAVCPAPEYCPEPDPEPIYIPPVVPEPQPAVPEPGLIKPAGSAPPTEVGPGPGPASFAKGYGEPPAYRFKRRDLLSADELSRQLLAAPELDLDADAGTSTRLVVAANHSNHKFTHPVVEPLLRRADLHGLPVTLGADCQLGKESAQNLQVLSRRLRAHLSLCLPADAADTRLDAGVLRQRLVVGDLTAFARPGPQVAAFAGPKPAGEADSWRHEDALPTLVQMLQSEDRPVRLVLVELLTTIKGRAASAALARRALFDLSAEVREAAVKALKGRPRDEYRALLLDGLRYPWAPAADHAAEALVALDDRASMPMLTALLEGPDPAGPVIRTFRKADPALIWAGPRPREPWPATVVALDERPGGEPRTSLLGEPSDRVRPLKGAPLEVYAVREVVRVNHLRNCLLCHAAATSPSDPVRGLVPSPGQPLPAPFSTPYYEGQRGIFVRADVTYLRQDFSVPQPVAQAGAWPAHQRYDYVVRTRYPTEAELRRTEPPTYPQREAVRWALRELGDGNGG
jgi:hypothetical protein